MLNKVILIGRLGQDPEIRYTQNGKAVAGFTIATEERWKKDGETHTRTEWHQIETWGKLAEICGEYLKKGKLIYIEGTLKTDKWEHDGKTHYKKKVVARDIKMLDSWEKYGKNQSDPADVDDDTIPF